MKASSATIAQLEEIAANAVPSESFQLLGGWLLRVSPSAPFRRNNSVLPLHGRGSGDLERRLTLVEEFYRRHGGPARYQISPAAPPALEDALVARGYALEVTSQVRVAPTAAVVAAAVTAIDAEVVVHEKIDAGWVATASDAHGADDAGRRRDAAYGRLVARTKGRAGGAVVSLPDVGVASAGFVVVERGWGGIFGMGTHPAARRRGAAAAVLHALARWAQAAGADRLYLQVEDDNAPALALYGRAGFEALYTYHYRTLGLAASPASKETKHGSAKPRGL